MLRDILKFDESSFSDELKHTVGVLDQVHRWPQIPSCPVVVSGSRKDGGCYHSLSHPSRPEKLEISCFTVYPSLTLVHEVGHMLDHMALNPIKRGFGSEHDPMFDPLYLVLETSRSVRKLIALNARKRPVVAPMIRKYLTYLLQPRELWARTYVQWVANRSKDILIVSQLRSATIEPLDEPPIFRKLGIGYYLDDDDFSRIIPVVDDLFRQRGLL